MDDQRFSVLIWLVFSIFVIFAFVFTNYAFADEHYGDEIMDQVTKGVESGISSIEVPEDNIIDTNQEEIDNVARSFSEWLDSLFDFGKKTHHLTEDAMVVAAPSWVDRLLISLVAGAVVIFLLWRVTKKVGFHIMIAMGALAAVIVFLMLLDLNF